MSIISWWGPSCPMSPRPITLKETVWKEVNSMDGISSSIAQYSMAAASARVSNEVQTSMLKNVMSLQEDMMAQLLQSMGIGGSLNVRG